MTTMADHRYYRCCGCGSYDIEAVVPMLFIQCGDDPNHLLLCFEGFPSDRVEGITYFNVQNGLWSGTFRDGVLPVNATKSPPPAKILWQGSMPKDIVGENEAWDFAMAAAGLEPRE